MSCVLKIAENLFMQLMILFGEMSVQESSLIPLFYRYVVLIFHLVFNYKCAFCSYFIMSPGVNWKFLFNLGMRFQLKIMTFLLNPIFTGITILGSVTPKSVQVRTVEVCQRQ